LGGVLLTFIAYWQVTALASVMVGAAALVNGIWLLPTPRDLSISEGRVGSAATSPQRPGFFRWLGVTTYTSFRPMWRDRPLLLLILASILMTVMLLQVAYAIPTFSLTYLGIPFGILGLALSLNGLIPVFTQVPMTKALSGRLHTRIGIWGLVAYVVSFVAFGLDSIVRFAVVGALFAVMIVVTLGENLIFLPMYTVPLNIAPTDSRGVYAGTITTASSIAQIFAPLLAGVALTFASQPLVTWGILAAPALPAILILGYLDSHLPREVNRI
jgi:hypothetical protein